MNPSARRAVGVTRSLVAVVRSESVTFVAASLAYYAFVSLLPLLLLGLVVASVVGGSKLADQVAADVATTLGPSAGDIVYEALTNAAGRGGATVFGLAVLLWSALKVFRGMDVAFSEVYGAESDESLVEQVTDAVVVLTAVGAGIVLTITVGMLISLPDVAAIFGAGLVNVVGPLLLVAGLTATLLPLYYFLPDDDLAIRDALPGAAFAAVGWTLLQTGFRYYARSAGNYEAYGVIGGVLLLVTLLYFGGVVLLVGVALNAVLDGRIGPQAATLGIDERDLKQAVSHDTELMTDQDDQAGTADTDSRTAERARFDDDAADSLEAEVERLRAELDERTRNREDLEQDLRRYVRRRQRRGKARGWGPYLVLLYGTAMTLGAFYFLDDGLWAVLAMFVVWTSTLGLYVLMLLFGVGLNVVGVPGRIRDAIQERR